MAKSRKSLNTLYDSLISNAAEELSPDDVAALKAEEAGETPPPPAPDAEAAIAEVETPDKQVEAAAEPTPEAPAEQPKEPKKLTPAQERIQELVRERNNYEEQLRNEREKWARLEERQRLINEQAERSRQEEEARRVAAEQAELRRTVRPDPSVDPVGAELFDTKERLNALAAEFEQAKQQVQAGFAQTQVQNDVARFEQQLLADIRQGQQKYSDYNEAAAFATQARKDFWLNLGNTEEESTRRVQAEALAIAKDALDHGKSPSEVYYGMAKQWGYAPQAGTSRGATAPAQSAARERLKQIEAGQRVQGFGGRSPNVSEGEDVDLANLSPAELAEMSEEAFLGLLRNPKSAAALQRRIAAMEGLT